jgi:predicted amidophosphoribosyltransferase
MNELTGRLKSEHDTVMSMTAIYCRDHHGSLDGELCEACAELMRYSQARLAKCVYGQDKPTCAKCPVHCYKPQPREDIRVIMRYAGPKMTFEHPWRALVHVFDKLRRAVHPMELRRARKRKESR